MTTDSIRSMELRTSGRRVPSCPVLALLGSFHQVYAERNAHEYVSQRVVDAGESLFKRAKPFLGNLILVEPGVFDRHADQQSQSGKQVQMLDGERRRMFIGIDVDHAENIVRAVEGNTHGRANAVINDTVRLSEPGVVLRVGRQYGVSRDVDVIDQSLAQWRPVGPLV